MENLLTTSNNPMLIPNENFISKIYIPSNIHFIEHFLGTKKNRSIHTYTNYKYAIKEFFNASNIEDITLDQIIQVNIIHAEIYMNNLLQKGFSNNTVNNRISALSSLYKWLLKYNDNSSGTTIIKYNPFANLNDEKPKPLVKRRTKYLETNDMSKLIKSINPNTILKLRNKLIAALLLSTAIRKSELINAKIGDIQKIQGYYALRVIQKGSKEHYAKLVPEVKELLDCYLERTNRNIINNSDDYIFINHSNNKNYYTNEKLSPYAINKLKNISSIVDGLEVDFIDEVIKSLKL